MSKQYLSERWENDDQFKILDEKIKNSIQNACAIRSELHPFNYLNEKVDLRGLKLDKLKIKSCKFEAIDFSFSSFQNSWIESSSFENCFFDKVDFTDFSDHGNKFNNCTFVACKFHFAAIGYDSTKFVTCSFDNCKFTKTVFNRPEFVGVIFKNCRMKNIDFNASYFENCTFEGELIDVWFRGSFPLKSDYKSFGVPKKNKMENVSFEKAKLEDLTFSDDCDLFSVKIKKFDVYYKFDNWEKRLLLLKSESSKWGNKEKKEAEVFANTYLVHAKNQHWYILNSKNLQRDYGNDIALKIIQQLNNFPKE